MAFCKNCGEKLENDVKFCPKCGTPTSSEAETPKSKDNKEEDDNDWKYGCLLLIIIGIVFCFILDTCSSNESSETDNSNVPKTEQVTSKKETNQKQEKKEDSVVGTYAITDKVGCTIHLTLKEDETATITGVRGEGVTYYCSWHNFANLGKIMIEFSDEKPYLVYEGGPDTNKYTSVYLKDGWLYAGDDNADAKNPKWRLKATKIK